MTNATEKLNWINEKIAAGKTVYVVTYTQLLKATPKTVAEWKATGNDLFFISDDKLMMRKGHGAINISFNGLKAA